MGWLGAYDVFEVGGVLCFRITDEGKGQSLKNVFRRWAGCRRSKAINLRLKDVDWTLPIVEATLRDNKTCRPAGASHHPLGGKEEEAVLRGLLKGIALKRQDLRHPPGRCDHRLGARLCAGWREGRADS